VKGRAQVALERGETAAAGLFRHARTVDPRDPSVVYGLAEALEAEGDPSALDLLRAALSERPDWVQGHELLARMRAEAGDEDFASDFAAAAERQPGDRAMQVALARTYASAELWNEALAVADRIAQDPEVAMLRAYLLGEAGEPERALALMESSAVQPDAAAHAATGRMALQAGDLSRAAQELERAVAIDINLVAAWSQLELAWRAAGNDRAHWLSGQPGLWSTQDIGLSADELEETAALLRLLHRTRAHPIGQSLRGGTQTRGRLFLREEPAIGRLHDALLAAVSRHAAQLPPADPHHPLLRHRGADLRIAGSWSVRLLSQGFHVHHIHPAGVLSSACYLALPDTLGDQADRSGWLELGRPPAGLNLSLEPLTAIEPAPGRLALFPSYLYHGTRPFRDGERLTVAFDVVAG
jgi:tetratricopeptide (TPR) repeat protein